jgi:osmotically-inducible protein OsmY
MKPNFARFLRATLLIVVVAFPVAALAQTEVVDLTAAFIENGVVIDQLAVSQISDIVLIRGRTGDRTKAEQASRVAKTLGYQRVANLIVIVDHAAADEAIVFVGQRRLELEPALAGCRFRVDSILGVIRLTGRVHFDTQAELAVHILSRIDGVKEIHPDLARL